MSMLSEQYKNWINQNPDAQISYEEWFIRWREIKKLPENFEPKISDDFMIGPDGAFEYIEEVHGKKIKSRKK